jgi:hypothetical protein
MGVWIEMFEEIGNSYDTISSGEQAEAYNQGLETCENIIRRYLGFNERGGVGVRWDLAWCFILGGAIGITMALLVR